MVTWMCAINETYPNEYLGSVHFLCLMVPQTHTYINIYRYMNIYIHAQRKGVIISLKSDIHPDIFRNEIFI